MQICITVSSFGTIVAIIGAIIDGLTAGFMTFLTTCINSESGSFTGSNSPSDIAAASKCAAINNNFLSGSNNCDCVLYSSGNTCTGNNQHCNKVSVTGFDYSCYESYNLFYKSASCGDMV